MKYPLSYFRPIIVIVSLTCACILNAQSGAPKSTNSQKSKSSVAEQLSRVRHPGTVQVKPLPDMLSPQDASELLENRNQIEEWQLVPMEVPTPLDYLNAIRQNCGMTQWIPNAELDDAALEHSKYQVALQEASHSEVAGNSHYRGDTIEDRILASGYPMLEGAYAENIHPRRSNQFQEWTSVVSLMRSIGHRKNFLKFGLSDIGVGAWFGENENELSFVTYKMSVSSYDRYDQNLQNNPGYAHYPYRYQSNFIPVYDHSNWDELKDYYATFGNPVSVHFNRGKNDLDSIELEGFTVTHLGTGQPVEDAYIMGDESDETRKMRKGHFAFFAANRFRFNQRYEASFRYNVGGVAMPEIKWEFQTKIPYPLYEIELGGVYDVQRGKTYAIYFPPIAVVEAHQETEPRLHGEGHAMTPRAGASILDLFSLTRYDPHTYLLKIPRDIGDDDHVHIIVDLPYDGTDEKVEIAQFNIATSDTADRNGMIR